MLRNEASSKIFHFPVGNVFICMPRREKRSRRDAEPYDKTVQLSLRVPFIKGKINEMIRGQLREKRH